MDAGIQALVVLSAFAAVHERALELVRRLLIGRSAQPAGGKPNSDPSSTQGLLGRFKLGKPWFVLVDGVTIGPWSVLLAIALAAGTHANLLDLFKQETTGGATQSTFFTKYMTFKVNIWTCDWQLWTGFVLMGLSTALGSKFWHDLAFGLVDLRQKATALPQTVRKLLDPPPTPPLPGLSGQAKEVK